ncbi:DNA-binding protein D-ETS-6 [Trichonephila clavata]|uniref:DNA-binding protein D-ETS-6 n=1 Tax=Trichonephila clavata TaxID=2740835 RepID=A0A8X6L8X1_TRICU|nr:DNA-binding protein D-ETS-6 [Trichonephila clavata]
MQTDVDVLFPEGCTYSEEGYNDEDLRKLPGETVKDTILRCFSGKKKNKLTSGGSPVLWQFIIDLLADPANSNIIYWQGDDGTFVIADRNKMAYRWGKEKAKKSDSETTMSYEKLSRSLRYYYNKNFLRKVTGERYAYQFHLPGLFNLVKLTRRISDAEFIQERFEVTSENINSLNVASFDRVWEDS